MIPHNRPSLGPEEEAASARVLRSGWVAQGPEVEALEAEFAGFLGMDKGHAVAFSSGTSALFVALTALGANGKSLAHPAYVCSAVRHAAALAGALPIAFDNAPGQANADIAAIASSGAEMAIIPHMYGLPADIRALAGIPVIEDCAQALGTSWAGKPVPSAGIVGVFSFSATKIMTTGGQGGMAVSRDAGLADAMRDYRSFDQRRDSLNRFNFQMTDLQAAIGRAQLRKLPGFLARRNDLFARYRRAGLDLLDAAATDVPWQAARYRAVLRTDDPGRAIRRLAENGIKAIVPLEDWELLGPADDFPRAAALCRTSVSLPLYPSLTDGDFSRIIATLEAA